MKKLVSLILICISVSVAAQHERPKLVVGIVVDQMRYDYLTRFWDKYGDGGFKKLVNNGFNCTVFYYSHL